ncbi:hypothetical protein SK803_26690 [Lentzea sp. BCCO 10_0856]|uniref:Nucleotidyltransferase domain-containing protein n=1 Tax=Lentzea miocenica TaxID=3095431 RepID=A0ABU4T6M6_9PSEU|nr:hypothetical protein [Lentzea sp. BCCO 10_0856]MDX8033825.1 hypothetical protein [Lentzea sp. BCCO 10_0856]
MTLTSALAVVGLTPEELESKLGAVLDEGEPYVVGSLASGFGNSASDVDVHVLVPGLEEPARPQLHFAGEVAVDVERYPAHWPADLITSARSAGVARLECGDIALETPLGSRSRRWASRWPYAVPVRDSPPIFDSDGMAALLPLLVRAAFDQVVMFAATARLADAAGAPGPARSQLWSRAERHLLELRCRAAGEVTTGQKWLPNRVRRLELAAVPPTGTAAGFAVARAEAGVPVVDEWELVTVRPAAGARAQTLAGRRYLVNRHDTLLGEWSEFTGTLAAAVAQLGAARVLAAVHRAELDVAVDGDAVRKALA